MMLQPWSRANADCSLFVHHDPIAGIGARRSWMIEQGNTSLFPSSPKM
jgi:hypothetical protein